MKHTILALLIIFICTEYGQAQLADNQSFTVAANHSDVYSGRDGFAVRTPANGMEIGYLAEKEILHGLLLSTGARISLVRFGMRDVGTSSIFYLSLPLDAKIMFPLNLYTRAGLRFDFKTFSYDARTPAVINGHEGYMGDSFASVSDFFVPGWSVGIGREFDIDGLKPWIEIGYARDFNQFSGHESIVSMEKKTVMVRLGIPMSRW